MKAYRYYRYGTPDVLRLEDVEKPLPKDDEVLVKIHAVSLNCYDWHFLSADIFLMRFMGGGLVRPRNPRLGADFAGSVEAVGGGVKDCKPGDGVFGDMAACGNGAFAEYACVRDGLLAPKPWKLSFEQAAAVPMAGVTALQALRDKGQVKAGQSVLVHGASGGVGTFAVQIAKALGAEVTAVCSERNVEQARALGADRVIDYSKEDFTGSGRRYDLILGVNGFRKLSAYKRSLSPQGAYVMVGGRPRQIVQGMVFAPRMSEAGGRRMTSLSASMNRNDLLVMKELIEAGKVVPVIDKRFGFAELPEAMRYLGKGHARGKIVVRVA
jgi:NADPH:quinone reductase-like Zn-dependent oxidoreductase